MCKVSLIIPAYNEALTIEKTISSVKNLEIDEIIVIDDGSKDGTFELAKSLGVKVIRLEKNSGKGNALNVGLKQATGKIIVILDADLGETAVESKKLLLPILNDEADMTIAKFPSSKIKTGFGFAKALSKFGVKKLTGLTLEFPLSGQRAIKKQVLDEIDGFAKGFSIETALNIDVAKRGFRILEVETNMKHRTTGRSLKDFFHRGKQFIAVMKILIKKLLEIQLS